MIVLVGFMGAGKTTVGRLLATKLGLSFVDTDDLVVQRAGRSIAEVFGSDGESGFRELEREVVLTSLERQDAVVALGGGSLADPAVAGVVRGKEVVHLDVSYPEAMRRLGDDAARPMLRRTDPRALYERRRAGYELVRRHTIATDNRSPDEIALEIARLVDETAAELPRRIVVPLRDRSYEVVVGRDLVSRLGDFIPGTSEAEAAFVVSHPSLERFSKEVEAGLVELGLPVHRLWVEEGERSKSLGSAGSLWQALARHQARRNDLLIAVGGGVVTDVAGFVAATYNRGMPLVHVPTTLLGQVDAAIGGKTGINIAEGKNLIGSIYQPRAVVCDVDLLASLPPEELRSGMAEVVKYGLIADPDLLDGIEETSARLFDGDRPSLIEIVSRSAAIKAGFVGGDELDRGERLFLNYGHTFAHAIEKVRAFEGIRHGEAVAVGMMAAAYLSNELGRLDENGIEIHRRSLKAVGLPTSAELELELLESAWQHDKKFERGVRFVLLETIGHPVAGVEAEPEAVATALRRLAA